MFCDANFEGGICCNPGSNPAALRIQGITTPEGRNFTFHNPSPQSRKLPALRAEVDEPGRLRPRLFLLLFFHTGFSFTPALRFHRGSTAAQIRLETFVGPLTLPSPPRGHTAANSGDISGTVFFFVLRVSFWYACPLWLHLSTDLIFNENEIIGFIFSPM